MDSNPSQPPVSTPVDTEMHKEDQQVTGGPTSLGVTSEERANPQLSSGMSAFNLNKHIYSASFIIHSESASGNDASALSTAEADPGNSAPSDFVPQQQGMNEKTKNTSYDHLFAGTDPHVIADQTKSVSKGLETVLTQPIIGKGASSVARQIEEETSSTIKLEDLAKLVSHVQPSFKDLDSPEDDPVIVVNDTDEDEEDEIHAATNDETEDTSVPKSLSQSSQIQDLTNQLNELLVKSLKTKLSNILSAHDFSSSLPTKLEDLPSKFNELTEEVKGLKKQVHILEIELPKDLKEILTKLKDFTKTVASVQAKLKTLDALLGLLLNVTQVLNKFAQILNSASSKVRDHSVPSVGQANTRPTEGEKDTNQATISQLFQRRGEHIKEDKGKKALSSKEAEKASTDSDSDDETHVTGSMVEPSRTKKLNKFDFITKDGRHIHLTEEEINHQKKLEEDAKAEAAKQEGEVRIAELVDLLGPKVVKKYYNDKLQYDKYCDKMLNRRAVSRITNCDVLTRKGPITLKVYREDCTSKIIPNFKASDLHLGEWREVMKACPNRTGKGWKTIYKQIDTRMDYIYTTKAELGINLNIPLRKQDPLDKLNDLANKMRKHADDIHDYFKANKRLKSSVQYKDHLPGTVLNEPVLGMILFNSYHKQDFVTIEDFRDFSNTMLYTVQEIFFRLHQGLRLDDHARTFSSLLLAKIDMRNLNPLKQMRVIEQMRQ
ncbi:hypothetical protein Tco_0431247 [Tanacetum coccineum]